LGPSLESFMEGGHLFPDLPEYTFLGKIGEGGYGHVWKALQVDTGTIVAIKSCQAGPEQQDGALPRSVLRELNILRSVQSPNVVALRAAVSRRGFVHLILEYIPEDLRQWLARRRGAPVTGGKLQYTSYQIFNGVGFCHKRRVLHRDLKPANILVDPMSFKLKITDFGLARHSHGPITYTQDVVTLWYRAPELLLQSPRYGEPVDMWSVGCILGEMITGRPMFPGRSEVGMIFKMFFALGSPTEDSWPGSSDLPCFGSAFPKFKPQGFGVLKAEAKSNPKLLPLDIVEILESLLKLCPQDRATATDVLASPYFRALYDEEPPTPSILPLRPVAQSPQPEEPMEIGRTESAVAANVGSLEARSPATSSAIASDGCELVSRILLNDSPESGASADLERCMASLDLSRPNPSSDVPTRGCV